VVAVPFYFVAMGTEYRRLRRRAATDGPSAGDYERRDTVASLAMGVGSLVLPLIVPRLLRPVTPGRGRYGRVLVVAALGAAAVTVVADRVVRRCEGDHRAEPDGRDRDIASDSVRRARRVAAAGGVAAVAMGGVAAATGWAALTTPERMWRHRVLPARDTGPLTLALAVAGWDFIYYWNHRLMHESRFMWALHVVHHSSRRYNLSTALRQPVADALSVALPYSLLCLLGIPPEAVATARGVNLLYQFWIHTETVGRLGAGERVLNTPSHHRVHHGSNPQYLDRNHGSILIVWDRLFGTFEVEGQRTVYGLTTNVDSFNVGRIATHEYADLLSDVAGSTGWSERLSHVLRGPGWAGRHRSRRRSPAQTLGVVGG